jgi:hypothetical protein
MEKETPAPTGEEAGGFQSSFERGGQIQESLTFPGIIPWSSIP